jgi:hypothetical protein
MLDRAAHRRSLPAGHCGRPGAAKRRGRAGTARRTAMATSVNDNYSQCKCVLFSTMVGDTLMDIQQGAPPSALLTIPADYGNSTRSSSSSASSTATSGSSRSEAGRVVSCQMPAVSYQSERMTAADS